MYSHRIPLRMGVFAPTISTDDEKCFPNQDNCLALISWSAFLKSPMWIGLRDLRLGLSSSKKVNLRDKVI